MIRKPLKRESEGTGDGGGFSGPYRGKKKKASQESRIKNDIVRRKWGERRRIQNNGGEMESTWGTID